MNSIDTKLQNKETIQHNLRILSQYALEGSCAFSISNEKNIPRIQLNGPVKKFLFPVFHSKNLHEQQLKNLVQSNISILQQADRSWFIQKDKTYTDLFGTAQKYNQTIAACQTSKKGLFSEWKNVLINIQSLKELAPLEVSRVSWKNLENIPLAQKPYLLQEGWFKKHNMYHYDERDASISHGMEAARIFTGTQSERILSIAGQAVEKIARIFGQTITFFHPFHYFRNDEMAHPERIYQNNPALANLDTPTSYWIGHSTCFMRIPLTSHSGKKVAVNLITDPVEGDLNKILYPRMTKPARLIEECPSIHVYLLSHNHLDHYNEATIKKLLTQQPVMIVPKGDGERFKRLGFKNVYEHDWWQTTTVTFRQLGETVDLKITALPAHHWSGQGFDNFRSTFLSYVIHGNDPKTGDIYFAGDTARLSEAHIKTIRELFNIKTIFQPGGPDEARKEMETTHQASADGLWMHVHLMIRRLYDTEHNRLSKKQWMQQAKKLKTIYIHTKTFKLGNLHFDDTDRSVRLVLDALHADQERLPALLRAMKDHEKKVYHELCEMAKEMTFDKKPLTPNDLYEILKDNVIVPKIGQLCQF